MGKGADYKGAAQGTLGVDGTVVGKYMTLHFSKPRELCNIKSEFYRIQIKQQNKLGCQGTKDEMQTVTKESDCITNE